MTNTTAFSKKQFLDDIKAMMTDEELSSKYGLSRPQLQRLFRELVHEGFLTEEELDQR